MVLDIPYRLFFASVVLFIIGITMIFALQGIYLFPVVAVIVVTLLFGGIFQLFTEIQQEDQVTTHKGLKTMAKVVRVSLVFALFISIILPGVSIGILVLLSTAIFVAPFLIEIENKKDKILFHNLQLMSLSPLLIPILGIILYGINIEEVLPNVLADFLMIGIVFTIIPVTYMIGIKNIQSNFTSSDNHSIT